MVLKHNASKYRGYLEMWAQSIVIASRKQKDERNPCERQVTQEQKGELVMANAAAAAKSLQSCLTLCDPIDGSPLGLPPSLGFSRQEHWSGLPFPSPMHESEK